MYVDNDGVVVGTEPPEPIGNEYTTPGEEPARVTYTDAARAAAEPAAASPTAASASARASLALTLISYLPRTAPRSRRRISPRSAGA